MELSRDTETPEEVEETRDGISESAAEDYSEAKDPDLGSQVKEREAIQRERDEYYDLLLRKQAEFENYRKRVQRESEEARVAAQAEIIAELLTVIDACEKGLDSMRSEKPAETLDSFADGYELLLRQLKALLERYDVREVPGVGAEFDPNIHEAVNREVGRDFDENEIVEEYRKGYLIGERLLRPSQVKVAVWPDE